MRLSLFSVPKPFVGHTGLIQRNALASWRAALPEAEILVCGDEAGIAEAAAGVAARHLPDIERTEYGTPLVSSALRLVAREARGDVLTYLNADLLLLPDFAAAVRNVRFPEFLMVARRWNLDVVEPLDCACRDWAGPLLQRVRARGELFRKDAIDVFVLPRGSRLVDLPPFAIGRPGWDNYVIYRARQLRIPVIDATPVMTIIHQNHGYGHVPQATGGRWEGPEADRNRKLLGGSERIFDIGDATHVLGPCGVVRARGLRRAVRAIETAHLHWPWLVPLGWFGFALRGIPPLTRRIVAAVQRR